jgi:hypothetical protein
MAAGAVVDHVVHDDAHPARVRLRDQFVEVGQRAEGRLDVAVVRDRVAVVAVAAAGDRHEPQAGHAERVQVVEPLVQALEIADAIAVAVGVAAHVDFREGAMHPVGWQGAGADDRRTGASTCGATIASPARPGPAEQAQVKAIAATMRRSGTGRRAQDVDKLR